MKKEKRMVGSEKRSLGQASRDAVELPRGSFAGLRFIDSHVHLGDYTDPLQELRFASASRGMLVTAGTDARSSNEGMALSMHRPTLVTAFIGVHPSEAEREVPDWIEKALPNATGIGEVGLDPKYSEVSMSSAQMKLFCFQLGLAEKARKPVQVHSRGAERECLDALGTFSVRDVLLHWFQGEQAIAEASDRGYYVSFGPALLTSKKLRRMARAYDRDHILAESDGPVRFAVLGGAGGSTLIPSVVYGLGELFGEPFEDTAIRLVRNSSEFLGLARVGS
jgi:TatD DNase family protein